MGRSSPLPEGPREQVQNTVRSTFEPWRSIDSNGRSLLTAPITSVIAGQKWVQKCDGSMRWRRTRGGVFSHACACFAVLLALRHSDLRLHLSLKQDYVRRAARLTLSIALAS
jgi:hypothetical protein